MISSMSTRRSSVGVGVVNSLLYAVSFLILIFKLTFTVELKLSSLIGTEPDPDNQIYQQLDNNGKYIIYFKRNQNNYRL